MAAESSDGQGGQGGVAGPIRSAASKNPATERLFTELEDFVSAQAHRLLGGAGNKVGELTRRLTDMAAGNGDGGGMLGRAAKGVMEGESPAKVVAKEGAKDVGKKVTAPFSKGKEGGEGQGQGGGSYTTIIEDLDIAVPVRVAYDQWTKFTEFPKWSKAAQSVDQEEPTKVKWNAKILFSQRTWESTITEQIPDKRIAWTSEGNQGVVNGVVTFHPLGESLTKIVVSLQYFPVGFVEKTANLWRSAGRRARLDMKLFRRFVMMGEADPEGGWRGEIRDSEVVSESDESEQDQDESEEGEGDEDEDVDEDEEDNEEEDEEEGEEDEDEEEEEEEPSRSRARRR